MTYYPGHHVCQFDGGRYENQNCAPTSLAMALDQATGGRLQRTGSEVRALIPQSEEQDPRTPGWSMHDVDRAAAKLGMDFTDAHGSLWRQLRALHDAGRGIVLSGDSDQFTSGCSGRFDGDHSIYVPAGASNPLGEWRVGDPICRAWTWATPLVLQRYAEKFGRKVYGVSTPQPITFGYTAEIPLVPPPTDTEDDADTEEIDMIDPTKDIPAAICDVLPGGPLRAANKVTVLAKSWPGGSHIGLYSRPVVTSGWAAIRIDRKGGPAEQFEVAWVPNNRVTNVRVT